MELVFDGFFVANFALSVICFIVLLGCFPKCARRYKWVFFSAIPPLLYLIGLYAYELVTKTMPPLEYRRPTVTTLLLLLITFISLTRNGNGYGKH